MNENFNKIINSNQLTLVDFYADWCGPCKTMNPILQQTKTVVKDKVKIIKVNIDTHKDVATEFMVRSVPTLILFKEGEILWKQSGVIPLNEIIQLLEKYYN